MAGPAAASLIHSSACEVESACSLYFELGKCRDLVQIAGEQVDKAVFDRPDRELFAAHDSSGPGDLLVHKGVGIFFHQTIRIDCGSLDSTTIRNAGGRSILGCE